MSVSEKLMNLFVISQYGNRNPLLLLKNVTLPFPFYNIDNLALPFYRKVEVNALLDIEKTTAECAYLGSLMRQFWGKGYVVPDEVPWKLCVIIIINHTSDTLFIKVLFKLATFLGKVAYIPPPSSWCSGPSSQVCTAWSLCGHKVYAEGVVWWYWHRIYTHLQAGRWCVHIRYQVCLWWA